MNKAAQPDMLEVRVYENRKVLGREAAQEAGERIRELLINQGSVNIVFAAAPSQQDFLEALVQESGIDWGQIQAFHMDEYVGLPADAPQRFGNFLKKAIFDRVPFRAVHYLNGNAPDLPAECLWYSRLLRAHPTDIVMMGIGENAHIAFNDPHVADFNDPQLVKVVDLDPACRQQQVNDGCFQRLEDVPTHALTLTIPALLQARYTFCMVPGESKAQAVYHTLYSDIQELYPATILRKQPNAILFLDQDSSRLLPDSLKLPVRKA